MRNLPRVTVTLQLCVILMLLTASSSSVAFGNLPTSPRVPTVSMVGCAHCERWGGPEIYQGEWYGECIDYESGTCRQCPDWVPGACGGWTWSGPTDQCNFTCNMSLVEVAEKLDAAILRDDPAAVRALLDENPKNVSFNGERNAIQVEGCGHAIIASLPLGDRVLQSLE